MNTNIILFKKFVFNFLFLSISIVGLYGCDGSSDEGGAPPPADPGSTNKVIGSTACLQDATTQSLVASISLADAAKGGRIYDKWWVAVSSSANTVPAPTTDHPIWSQQTTNTRTGADTWRCKECHGWDYKGVDGVYGDTTNSHYTGFTGIFDARSKDPAEVYCAIRNGSAIDADHAFLDLISDVDILHLTKFITASQNELPNEPAPIGIIDVDLHFDAQGAPISATPSSGELLYADNNIDCASSSCHGADGTAQHEAVGTLADDNPWETLHKIRFGHPGSNMPAFTSPTRLTTQQSVDIIAYAQDSLPNPEGNDTCMANYATFVSNGVALANPIRGGRFYDKWWTEAGSAAPTEDHPIWSQQSTNTRTGADTWRCKECHGWDYKGADGVYGDTTNSHYTGFPGVLPAQADPVLDVFCAIRSGTGLNTQGHNFASVLTDANILDLASFITSPSTGLVETNTYINFTTGASLGDSVAGETLYTSVNGCSASNCHGVDGAAQHEPLGALSDDNPWEVLHKIRFGHPGAIMPAYADPSNSATLSLDEMSDVIRYAQVSLDATTPGGGGGTPTPTSELQILARGGRLYDNWIVESGAPVPLVDNPTWALQSFTGGTNTRTGADTWRCKECHGWDYKGSAGVYGDPTGSHYTGFGGILGTEKTEAEIVQYLISGTIIFGQPVHSFDGLMTLEDMEALAKFIKVGMVDSAPYIGPSGFVNGLPANFNNGRELYRWNNDFGTPNGNCELCHDADGNGEQGLILGDVARSNPWETLHKILFGQPGTPMPSLVTQTNPATGNAAFDTQDAVDIVQFSQCLPDPACWQ